MMSSVCYISQAVCVVSAKSFICYIYANCVLHKSSSQCYISHILCYIMSSVCNKTNIIFFCSTVVCDLFLCVTSAKSVLHLNQVLCATSAKFVSQLAAR